MRAGSYPPGAHLTSILSMNCYLCHASQAGSKQKSDTHLSQVRSTCFVGGKKVNLQLGGSVAVADGILIWSVGLNRGLLSSFPVILHEVHHKCVCALNVSIGIKNCISNMPDISPAFGLAV